MGKLVVLNRRGDNTVTWDMERALAGDTEAKLAVLEAERIVNEGLQKGSAAFAVVPGTNEGKKIKRFDPNAEQIVVVPPMRGGSA